MIPILYDREFDDIVADVIQNNTNGLGMLTDCISAVVTEERNGSYELEIEYPVNGVHFDEISYSSWIKVKPYAGNDVEVFRVYRISKPVNGICTINAEHISYAMSYILVQPWSVQSWYYYDIESLLSEALSHLNPFRSFTFTVTTTKTDQNVVNYYLRDVVTLKEFLSGEENSLVSCFPGGEFKYSGLNVCYYESRGSNKGVRIAYGRNMTTLRQDISDASAINCVYPYWAGETGGSFQIIDRSTYGGVAGVYNSDAVTKFPFYVRAVPLPMQEDERWQSTPPVYDPGTSTDDFQTFADEYFYAYQEKMTPETNIDVSFVDLASTEEYKNIYPLGSVNLCDIVTVEYAEFGITEQFKVVKTEYNVLEERYNAITLGSLRKTLN